MRRLRLGILISLPLPIAFEVDGVRKAMGSVGVSKIHPHITLVAPFNATVERLIEIEGAIWPIVAKAEPFTITVGPAATFSETSPVLFYSVKSENNELARLAFNLEQGVSQTIGRRGFVPHVTIADGISPEVVASAVGLLSKYKAEFDLLGVDLCEKPEESGSSWRIRARWMLADQLKYVTVGTSRVRIGRRRGVSPSVEAELNRLALVPPDLPPDQSAFDTDSVVSIEAWSQGSLLGVVIMGRVLGTFRIETLYVEVSMRLMGLGTRLVREAVSYASEVRATELTVFGPDETAGFLERLGFNPQSQERVSTSPGDQNGMILYRLSLAS